MFNLVIYETNVDCVIEKSDISGLNVYHFKNTCNLLTKHYNILLK